MRDVYLVRCRADWNGCVEQMKLYSEDPVNLTCKGEKRFDTHEHWAAGVSGDDVRRVYLAVSNCPSSSGLLLHYRLTVYGNVASTPCSNSATRTTTYSAAISTLLFLLLMML